MYYIGNNGNLWLQAVPFQFLHALLTYLGDSVCPDCPSSGLNSPLASRPSSFYSGVDSPSEDLIRWKLRLEYFAYETLQDLRIAKLFDLIVDFPERSDSVYFFVIVEHLYYICNEFHI